MQQHFLFCGWHLDHGRQSEVFSSLSKCNCGLWKRLLRFGSLCQTGNSKTGVSLLIGGSKLHQNNNSRPLDFIRGSKASNSEAGCHLPARMTAGEPLNFKTTLKSPYLSLQIWWIILASIIFFLKQLPLWRRSRNLPRQHVRSLNKNQPEETDKMCRQRNLVSFCFIYYRFRSCLSEWNVLIEVCTKTWNSQRATQMFKLCKVAWWQRS